MQVIRLMCLFCLTIIALQANAGGRYGLIQSATGKCLDVDGGRADNLAPVIAWDCHGRANQLWKMDRKGRLRPKHAPHMCLEAGQNLRQGDKAFIYECHSGRHQRWQWNGNTLQNKANRGVVLDYFVDQGRVGVWPRHNRSNQKWYWQPRQSRNNDKFLDQFFYQEEQQYNYKPACRTKDRRAGPIWDQRHANETCPGVCAAYNSRWTGHWNTVEWGSMSVCQCKRC
ncbi:ricin-type beta-trefoil lectin domain protein [Spartinivicinus poritis]|uniref:Ricin-type beta-trefoil lectin domain protein n=1 Tax=Spartinivicinus poritis TaxID=2994640 RepID=A0ABT5U6X2_9GAMM|nr:ricin-type beta-trefoil lectin domain protein [Spartinivicinus sp. A2-2]MDE1461731.1 ricin-type beta-trefoil lectin domain protein [Spartinivicinus sp. A2-2]